MNQKDNQRNELTIEQLEEVAGGVETDVQYREKGLEESGDGSCQVTDICGGNMNYFRR